ncbi:MAG: hypothetical protein ACI4M6_04560 [Christensenellaceae bacterium]
MNAKDVVILLLLLDNVSSKSRLCKTERRLEECKRKQKKKNCTYKKYCR